MQAITLTENLHHPGYSWPESLVFLPGKAPAEQPFHLVDAQGRAYAAQETGEGKIALCTALLCGEEKRFQPMPGRAEQALRWRRTKGEIWADNGKIALVVREDGDVLFSLQSADAGFRGVARLNVPLAEKHVALVQAGDVFCDVCIEARAAVGGRYRLSLRLALGMEYLEMREEMHGFTAGNAALVIEWPGFQPTHRLNHYRGEEYIDQYLEPDGRIPTLVAPYDSWVSWWQDKTVSFRDDTAAVGVFIRCAEAWDDGEYALWRSSATLAVRFYYQEEALRFVYPLANGCRGTALSCFPQELDGSARGPKSDGLVKQDTSSPMRLTHMEELWFWHEFLALDKVKDWVLRWPEEQKAYPRFFTDDKVPGNGWHLWYLGHVKGDLTPAQVEKVVYELSDSLNQMARTGAVSNREFYDWAILFDRTLARMNERQFDDLRAAFAFCAYAFSDENYMPVQNMLAGHPNFLADARGVAAVAAALFPHHPHAQAWRHTYELAMARNLKYHTRPDVRAWDCLGGRWTENLGCYVHAMLRPFNQAQVLLHLTYGDYAGLYPALPKLWRYLLGTLSAPVDGVRRFPSLGAHSDVRPANGYELLNWGDALFGYAPLLAENLWYLGRKDTPGFEERVADTSPYRLLDNRPEAKLGGTRPRLVSAKYTGHGFVLRSRVYEPDEMAVQLIQIDEGPNYRWGCAAQGGCGSLCYWADGRQWGGQRREDVGDWNKGDAQATCNFGVLIGHEYHSVGRNDLTEPLCDFGFAQYARVNANAGVSAFYRYRSVIMSGNDYITVYDAVTDQHVHGRFSWFNDSREKFPSIVQLKPGAGYVPSQGGVPVDAPGLAEDGDFTGRYYEGNGDFLTLVSHRPFNQDRGTYTTVKEYGVLVEMQGRADFVFQRDARIRHREGDIQFDGRAGIVRRYGKTLAQAALFDGRAIAAGGARAECENAAIGFTVENHRLSGAILARENARVTLRLDAPSGGYRLYLNGREAPAQGVEGGICFTVPAGRVEFEWTDAPAKPMPPEILGCRVGDGCALLSWRGEAQRYRVELSEDGGNTWLSALETEQTHCRLHDLHNGRKYHARVRGANQGREGEPCWEYPLYPTARPAQAPDGLRVVREGQGYRVTWGEVLGASEYRLYRLAGNVRALAYAGPLREFLAGPEEAVYAVSAVNGNGEGALSTARATQADGLEHWDPRPEEAFRRYWVSHEYGYFLHDFWHDYLRQKRFTYPD